MGYKTIWPLYSRTVEWGQRLKVISSVWDWVSLKSRLGDSLLSLMVDRFLLMFQFAIWFRIESTRRINLAKVMKTCKNWQIGIEAKLDKVVLGTSLIDRGWFVDKKSPHALSPVWSPIWINLLDIMSHITCLTIFFPQKKKKFIFILLIYMKILNKQLFRAKKYINSYISVFLDVVFSTNLWTSKFVPSLFSNVMFVVLFISIFIYFLLLASNFLCQYYSIIQKD